MPEFKIINFKESNFFENVFYNKPLLESDHFKVIPSLGAIVEGWVMIVPKSYYISVGAINDDILYLELDELLLMLGLLMKRYYGDYLLFEHGPNFKKSPIGCSVDYAHLHVVPASINLIKSSSIFIEKKIQWESVNDIKKTASYASKNLPYLYVREIDGSSFIGTAENLPSQLFRKVIADAVGMKEMYNWREYFFAENINNTIQKFSKQNQTNQLQLS